MNTLAAHGFEIVRSIDGVIRAIYDDHTAKQKLWMPTELLPEDFKARPLPPAIKAMLVLNLLTEDGLPYFFGLLVTHLGVESAIGDWTRKWTGEEFRHGRAIQLFLNRVLSREQIIEVERMQYAYLNTGFWPNWGGDPVKLLAYVVLQEEATRVSHFGIAKAAEEYDPVLHSLMKKISAEEAKHHTAYLGMFKAALLADADHGLEALLHIIRNFAMPGNGIKDFSVLSEIQGRSGVFGSAEFVSIVEDVCEKIGLGNLTGLGARGEKARDGIFSSIKVLRRVAGRKVEVQTFTLPGFGAEFEITL